RVTSTTVAACTSTSNTFTISNAPSPTSTITITYPKGGEHWPKGQYYLISWKYTGNPGNSVKIELLKGGTLYNTITSGTLTGSNGNGYYSWHISIFQASGSNFQVRITSASNPYMTSTSGYFSIGY
ncbi:MAG: Ser-Thr-rich GPI-anchored membrane family protein, partial [Thermacetogeniaceae bacterium]